MGGLTYYLKTLKEREQETDNEKNMGNYNLATDRVS